MARVACGPRVPLVVVLTDVTRYHGDRLLRISLLPGADGRAFNHIADRLPGAAVELDQSHLLDGPEVGRCRADGNAGQQDRRLIVCEPRRLTHDVFPRQVVA